MTDEKIKRVQQYKEEQRKLEKNDGLYEMAAGVTKFDADRIK